VLFAPVFGRADIRDGITILSNTSSNVTQPMNTTMIFQGPTSRMKRRVLKPKPWHILAVNLLSQGKTLTQVAKELGHARQTVSVLWAQDWFKRLVAETMERAALPLIRERLTVPNTKPERPWRSLRRTLDRGAF
jgi:DNA-binding NarL/FixJ family response regulator